MKFRPVALTVTLLLTSPLFAEPVTQPTTQPTTRPADVEKIDVARFDVLRAEKDQVVLDVRTPAEFAAGHVPGAVNVPFNKTDFAAAIASLDKSTGYLVYCHSGKRSFLATQQMQAGGFEHLQNFTGGIVAWERAGKPMEPAK